MQELQDRIRHGIVSASPGWARRASHLVPTRRLFGYFADTPCAWSSSHRTNGPLKTYLASDQSGRLGTPLLAASLLNARPRRRGWRWRIERSRVTGCRLRALSAYIARSASRSRLAPSAPLNGYQLMPMLQPTVTRTPPTETGVRTRVEILARAANDHCQSSRG
jgi:hypothetical protein